MIMLVKDTRTNGAKPVKVSMEADNIHLIVHWRDMDLEFLVDDIREVMEGDDGR